MSEVHLLITCMVESEQEGIVFCFHFMFQSLKWCTCTLSLSVVLFPSHSLLPPLSPRWCTYSNSLSRSILLNFFVCLSLNFFVCYSLAHHSISPFRLSSPSPSFSYFTLSHSPKSLFVSLIVYLSPSHPTRIYLHTPSPSPNHSLSVSLYSSPPCNPPLLLPISLSFTFPGV